MAATKTRKTKAAPVEPELLEHEQIATRAYEIHEQGAGSGDPVEDWLQAEQELLAEQGAKAD